MKMDFLNYLEYLIFVFEFRYLEDDELSNYWCVWFLIWEIGFEIIVYLLKLFNN